MNANVYRITYNVSTWLGHGQMVLKFPTWHGYASAYIFSRQVHLGLSRQKEVHILMFNRSPNFNGDKNVFAFRVPSGQLSIYRPST